MKKIAILLIVIYFSGCSAPIKYSLKPVQKYSASKFASKTLAVRTFEDVRKERFHGKEGWSSLATGLSNEIERDGQKWFVNADINYKNHEITSGVTNMIIRHMKASRMFRDVSLEGQMKSNLLLEGKIERFEAFKEVRTVTQVGTLFGLVGMLSTAGVKSPYDAHTVLIDINLTDQDKNAILWSGKVEGVLKGESYADPTGNNVYSHANESLRDAVEKMLQNFSKI